MSSSQAQFPALLKNADGQVLASGQAYLLQSQRSVTFESDFVPLYPIGTPMEIVRMYRGEPVHRFCGQVYLSDKALMRLVQVTDILLPGCEYVYCNELNFTGMMTVLPDTPPTLMERLGLRLLTASAEQYAITLTELSRDYLVFSHDIQQPLSIGQRLLIQADAPVPLPETPVEITKSLLFGSQASYTCRFTKLSKEARDELQLFMRRHVMQTRKLF